MIKLIKILLAVTVLMVTCILIVPLGSFLYTILPLIITVSVIVAMGYIMVFLSPFLR